MEPKEVLLHAEEFRRAMMVLELQAFHKKGQDPHVLIPMFMCSAFACELYMKFLILRLTGSPPEHTHDLKKLFKAIPKDVAGRIRRAWENPKPSQAAFRKHFAKAAGRKSLSFDYVLERSAHAFQRLRYSYAYEKGALSWLGGDIGESTRAVIYEMYPTEYADVRLALPDGILNKDQAQWVKAYEATPLRDRVVKVHRSVHVPASRKPKTTG